MATVEAITDNVAAVTLVDGDRPFRATVPDSLTVSEDDTVVVGYTTSGSAYIENALTQARGDSDGAQPANISVSPSSGRATILEAENTVYWDGAQQETIAGDADYGGNFDSIRGTGWYSRAIADDYLVFDFSDLVEQYENPVLFNTYNTNFAFLDHAVYDNQTDELLLQASDHRPYPLVVYPLANTSGELRIGPNDAKQSNLSLSGALRFDNIDIDTAWERPAPGDNSGLVDTFGAGDSFESTYGRDFSNQKWQQRSGPTGDIAEKYQILGASGNIAVSDSAVIARNNDYVFAFERTDKTKRWAVDVGGNLPNAGPQFYGGAVYLAAAIDTYYTIDAQTGNATEIPMDPSNYTTAGISGLAELFVYDGDFVAVYQDTDGNKLVVRFDTSGSVVWSSDISPLGGATTAAAIDYPTGNIIVLLGDVSEHRTKILALADGTTVSSTTASRTAQEGYSPTCVGGNAYFVAEATDDTTDPGMEKVDMSDGSRTNEKNVDLGGVLSNSIGTDGTDLIVLSNGAGIVSIPLSDPSTTNWFDYFNTQGPLENFVVMDNHVYTGADGSELRRYKKSDGTLEQTGQVCDAVYAGFENQLFIRGNNSNGNVVNLVQEK